jgi:prepilin-type processing-associated H-X9-DG protein
VELLVTISIIGLLAGLLLPVLGRSKEQAKLTQCLGNLHQIGLGFEMYRQDHSDRFPTRPFVWAGFQYGGADPNWTNLTIDAPDLISAINRPLWSYISAPEVFHCPGDRGMDFSPIYGTPFPNVFRTIGTSYVYNYSSWARTKEAQADPDVGLAGKPYSWIPDSARHILLFEPPALPYQTLSGSGDLYFLWHFNSGTSTVHSPKDIHQKVVSPVLFVDGHAAVHDFTVAVKSPWPAEPTANWVWYKPAR